jgi:hypothetical protein
MDRPMDNLGFRFMSVYFRFRDYFSPPNKILEKVGIPVGSIILDLAPDLGVIPFQLHNLLDLQEQSMQPTYTF